MLQRIQDQPEIKLFAYDIVDCAPYFKKKDSKLLNTDDEDSSRTGGLPKVITVKIGSNLMITKNIDITLGLINGTICKIIAVSRNIDNENDIQSVTLLLNSGKECTIERMSVKFEVIERVYIIRKQFPISLSYAIIIHKSQGVYKIQL